MIGPGTRLIGAAAIWVLPVRSSGAANAACRRSSRAARVATLADGRASSAATAARSAEDKAKVRARIAWFAQPRPACDDWAQRALLPGRKARQ